MGYEAEANQRASNTVLTLDLPRAVRASVASFRDAFRSILGSDPIVEQNVPNEYVICTYGAGQYERIGWFSLTQLPGCCGILVFYHAAVASKFQRRGLGELFLKIRENAAVLAGYSRGLATTLESNKVEQRLLEKLGWVEVFEFDNQRTGNKVLTYTKQFHS